MIKQALQQVLDSQIENYTAPKRWSINGVKVYYKPDPTGVSAREWRDTLETWLPRFDEAGWLDELKNIQIGDSVTSRDAVGQYQHDGVVLLENDVSSLSNSVTVCDKKESVLIHEFVHHAHLTLNGYEDGSKASNKSAMLKEDVSYYAGTDVGEAVAEIGTAIVRDIDIPEWAHDYYDEKDGPQEVYEVQWQNDTTS